MKSLILIFILLLCLASIAFSQSLNDDFETDKPNSEWGFYNGPEFPGAKGSISFIRKAAYSGNRGLALGFDFSDGGNYVQCGRPINTNFSVSGVDLWIKSTGINSIGLRLSDSEGQTFQKTFKIPHDKWQKIHISFSGWTGFWGGENDAVFRGVPTNFAVLVENNPASRKGVIYMDDIKFVDSGKTSGIEDTAYIASDFVSGFPWMLTGDGIYDGSSYSNGVFKFDFLHNANEIGIISDLALMGTAKQVKLKIDSSVTGIKIKMRIGSHFQSFEKIIGETDGTNGQVISAELGGMKSWNHFGGENDGQVRWPLRLAFIGVDKNNQIKSGVLKFIELSAISQVAPDSAIIPVPYGKIDGNIARFTCNATNLLPDKFNGKLDYIIKNFNGIALRKGSRRVNIEKGDTWTFNTSIDIGDLAFAECEFRLIANGYVYGSVVSSAVKPISDAGSNELEPDSIYGMGLYLYRYSDRNMMKRAAETARAAGVKWSREEMLWHVIEPERGKFNWTHYDNVVDTAFSHGISVYGLIDYWSEWTKPYTQEGIDDYVAYCKALVGRYKDRVKHWEIWNEPNIFFWPGPKEVYPQLLKAAYKAIKEVDPDAKVLGCSTAGIDSAFIKMVMDAGAPFDILTVHPYRAELIDEQFIKELQDVYELTASADGNPKLVWITEMGWPTDIPNGWSERQQASFLARTYLCSAVSGVTGSVSWYNFREDGSCPFYNEHRFGVVRHSDLSPKPAYRALASVCRTLSGQKLVNQLNLGDGILAYKFAGRNRETAVLWSRGKNAILNLKISGKDLIMRDLMYQDTVLNDASQTLSIFAKQDIPVFITGSMVDVSNASAPAYLISDNAVKQGESAIIRLTSEIGFYRLDAVMPFGWKFEKIANNSLKIDIPNTENSGVKQVNVMITGLGKRFAVPIDIEVLPEVMEF